MSDLTPPEAMDELIAQYVKVRDKLADADKAHDEKTKVARDYLKLLNAKLLEKLNEVGGESVKTEAGTAYRTTRKSATIADGSVFRAFVVENALFDIVDWKANANAVDDYVKSEGALPPGVNYSVAYTVGVRRPT